MASFTHYEPNEAGYIAMALSKDIQDACVKVATVGKGIAVGISPKGRTRKDRDEPRYSQQFDVERTTVSDVGRFKRPRVAARLVNSATYAASVEFRPRKGGTPYAVMRKTASILGGGVPVEGADV